MPNDMQYYDCRLRLAGSTQNEIHKKAITAPELLILRKLHGDESVLDIKQVDIPAYKPKSYTSSRDKQLIAEGLMRDPAEIDPDEDFDDDNERQRLAGMYGRGLGFDPAKDETPMTAIERLFGGQYVPLPRILPELKKAAAKAAKQKEAPTGKGKKLDDQLSKIA